MILHNYKSSSGKDVIFEYIDGLTEDERVDALSVIECLKQDRMEEIKFKRWEKKVYEVYFYKYNRIFYVVADEENMYLLHACRKQKNQTEKMDKKIIVKRAKELGKILGKSFI